MFGNNEVVEIETSQYRAIARVRNIQGDRIHVAVESGYLPWIDDPVNVRSANAPNSAGFDARIVHASGSTALIEILDEVESPAVTSTARMPAMRDTKPDLS